MKNFNSYSLLFTVLGYCLSAVSCSSSKAVVVNKVEPDPKVLIGVWQLKDNQIFEKWTQLSVTEYLGVSYDMSPGIAEINETMRIFKADNNWIFEAKTKENKFQPVQFMWSADPVWHLMFLNEKNEYPNIIKYRISEEGSLNAQISNLNGEKVKEFIFHKVMLK
ncbi:MAG: hypothetical protein IPO72_02775 [Saprospiraceae bacterium]|nr:hypothetical protein [Candidatus Vicinibacter affinis]MBK6570986.1 hypothetical protein [Candidatus Vicinibacter affinis]MBK8641711.1 hypothetical protein [Candidatus Vicinibacter affinis]MBK9640225.1 hypothetical protein [Candidatus Vicinibacter affinis]